MGLPSPLARESPQAGGGLPVPGPAMEPLVPGSQEGTRRAQWPTFCANSPHRTNFKPSISRHAGVPRPSDESHAQRSGPTIGDRCTKRTACFIDSGAMIGQFAFHCVRSFHAPPSPCCNETMQRCLCWPATSPPLTTAQQEKKKNNVPALCPAHDELSLLHRRSQPRCPNVGLIGAQLSRGNGQDRGLRALQVNRGSTSQANTALLDSLLPLLPLFSPPVPLPVVSPFAIAEAGRTRFD